VEGERLSQGIGAVQYAGPRRVLHAGCGRSPLPEFLHGCTETRLDIDPSVAPDVVASMANIGDIGPFDAIWCSHSLEHLLPIDGAQALREFARVLAPGGYVMIIVPDLEDVRPTNDVLYESGVGPITGLHLFYGHDGLENPHMLHRTGFMAVTLKDALEAAGFSKVTTQRLNNYNLLGIGVK